MSSSRTIVVISDIHYASPAEQARHAHETRVIRNPLLRLLVWVYRRNFWMRDPFAHNDILERFMATAGKPDMVVANGDYSCDTAFVGISDDAAFLSAASCLAQLRARFGPRLTAVLGDHELGKMSLFGGVGGLRLASWRRAADELGFEPFWLRAHGRYILVGVVSSLIALPIFEPETLVEEREEWWRLRGEHLKQIRSAFEALGVDQRVVLFCHDPTALSFLAQEEEIGERLDQIEYTIIGHLHSPVVLGASRLLAGIPALRFMGNSIRRMTEALRDARAWRPFNVRLCPSLAGCELLKDGGYSSLEIDTDGEHPVRWRIHPLPR